MFRLGTLLASSMSAAALLILPLAAAGQTGADLYHVVRVNEPYVPLGPGATVVPVAAESVDQLIQMPFSVRFFGDEYTSFRVGHKGYITFTGSASAWSNQAIPSSTVPNAVVAAWWDDLECPSGGILSEIQGTAPNRSMVIQWNCHAFVNTTPNWNAQIHLYEGSSTIKLSYGTATHSSNYTATVGIEDANAQFAWEGPGATGGPCGSSCGLADWFPDTAILFVQGPDLTVSSVTSEPIGWAGIPMAYSAEIANIGGEAAADVRVRFWASSDPILSPDDDYLIGFADETQDLPFQGTATFTLFADLPLDLPSGPHYIIAEVDPEELVEEALRGNNVGASAAFIVGEPTPDLLVEAIEVPEVVELGTPFDLELTVRNRGNLLADDVGYSIVLSRDTLITRSDVEIATGRFSIDWRTSLEITQEVTIPEVPPGQYYVGVILDPDLEIHEIDEFNNDGIADRPIVVTEGDLQIVTISLPPAELGGHYCRFLEAEGGDGTYTWSLIGGELPVGIAIREERSGDQVLASHLCGTPSQLGTHRFTLEVASHDLVARRDFELVVTPSDGSLVVVTDLLPEGAVASRYDFEIGAIGGKAPYTWSITDGSMPQGLGLRQDGQFFGFPKEQGAFSIGIQVEDADGRKASRTFDLVVQEADAISCMSTTLPSTLLGESYDTQLNVSGGEAPYKWTTLEGRRLPSMNDAGETFVGKPPPGMNLDQSGRVGGTPEQAGRYIWLVQVEEADGVGRRSRCALTFDVFYDQGLVIRTSTLRPAVAGERYHVELVVEGGEAPIEWSLAPGSSLPPGFELADDGTLGGAFERQQLGGEPSQAWDFTVQVQDRRNRWTTKAFRLELRSDALVWDPPPVGDPITEGCEGCGAGGAGTGLLGLLLVAGLAAGRRRRD